MARSRVRTAVTGALTAAIVFFIAGMASCAPVPTRIVSLYPGHTDNIVALGVGDRLVAVSREDAAEPLLPDLPRLSPKVDAEAVLALRPDAVFLRSLVERMNPHLTEVLERAGVAVHVIDPPSWEGFGDYLARLAEILGTDPNEARRRLAASRELVAESAKKAAGGRGGAAPTVFLEATSRELHTCAPDSWAANLIELAGGVNAAEDATPLREGSSLAAWGVERVLAAASHIDVYIVQRGAMNVATPEEVRSRAWGGALECVRIVAVQESLLSRPSLFGLEKGGALLLEIFNQSSK